MLIVVFVIPRDLINILNFMQKRYLNIFQYSLKILKMSSNNSIDQIKQNVILTKQTIAELKNEVNFQIKENLRTKLLF